MESGANPRDASAVLRVGTSGWSYPPSSGPGSWTGVFYPWTKADELQFYSRYFNVVEVNSTFYRPCTSRMAEGWLRRTPANFEFTVKAWQQFTHRKGLWAPGDVRQFQTGLAPLVEGKKLGCLLFQFPASFKASDENIQQLQRLLGEFEIYPKAVELRHNSWGQHLELLLNFNATPAFIDEPKFHSSIRQEMEASGSIIYLRFHGRQFQKWWKHEHRNERYDYLYGPEELRPFAARLKQTALEKGLRRAYAFFNNHPGAKAVANAIMFRAELANPVDEELPERLVQTFPALKEYASGGADPKKTLFPFLEA